MQTFLNSIRGKVILTGSVLFFIAAAAAFFAISKFSESSQSLNTIIQKSIPVSEHARHLDDLAQRFSKEVLNSTQANSHQDYMRHQRKTNDFWKQIQHHAKLLTNEMNTSSSSLIEQVLYTLQKNYADLDATMLKFVKLRDNEFETFDLLETELKQSRLQTSALKDIAEFDLSLTMSDLLDAEDVAKGEIERLINFDFRRFQFSLEIDIILAEILNILRQIPQLKSVDEIDPLRGEFKHHLDNLEKNVKALTAGGNNAPDILDKLKTAGMGQSNIFDRWAELIELESSMEGSRLAFISISNALLSESRRLTVVLVESTSDEIKSIEETVNESRLVTVLLLFTAFIGAIFIGWKLVGKGILEPVSHVEDAMVQIAYGEVKTVLPNPNTIELKRMVDALGLLRDYVDRVKEAEETVRQKTALLEGVLVSLNQGVVAFDKDLKLIIHNRRFLEVRDYPEELVFEGQDFEKLIRFDVERKEFGDGDPDQQFQERFDLAKKFVQHQFERQRPNGAYIDVRGGGLPDGGFVSTYTDITKRVTAEKALAKAHEEITSSINYASHMQRSLLPPDYVLEEHFSEHFLIWKPKQTIGGDIIWLRNWGKGKLVIVGDCTGHGVPGAFMTMLATGALDQSRAAVEPGELSDLMEQMHQIIQKSQHNKTEESSSDGMEIGICYIKEDKSFQFCGARFSLFIADEAGVQEMKGDRKGIGYSRLSYNRTFETVSIPHHENNTYYMTSDGYIDQLSGSEKKKFGKKRFVELLKQHNGNQMKRQKAVLLEDHVNFRGTQEQIDDLVVLGFRL